MIDHNQTALLELLKASLFGGEPRLPADIDWDAVFAEAKSHAVEALAAPCVPPEEAPRWREAADRSAAYYLQLAFYQRELVRLFENAGIPLVILKGTAAAVYYPEPSRRTMGDIDFLVPLDRFDEAKRLMMDSGYTLEKDITPDSRHAVLIRYGVEFELHLRFGGRLWPSIEAGLQHVETATVSGVQFPILPTMENGLVLFGHVRQHLLDTNSSLGLRQMIDWMLYVHANAGDPEWERGFMDLMRQYELETPAATVTAVCKTYLGLPDDLPWPADAQATEKLFDRIMSSGNFGSKKNRDETVVQDKLLTIRRMGTFKYLQTAGLANWKAAQRCRILRPLAWLYQLFRYAWKVLVGLLKGEKLGKGLAAGKEEDDFNRSIGL